MKATASHKVELQNKLRDFTVQIRHATTDMIVGTGFCVSICGKIVTCVHVVRDANEFREVAEGVEVGVYFPQVRNTEMKAQRAKVAACFQEYDDDVVVLQLDTSYLPDGVKVAILGTAEDSEGNKFRSFGYRRLDNYQGLPAQGEIIGFAECPFDRKLHSDPLTLTSQTIDSGMSGGAVLDMTRDLVVGVIAETWDSGASQKDRDTSFAVDSQVLSFTPMHLPMQGLPISQAETFEPVRLADISEPQEEATPEPGIHLDNAPLPLSEWVGRVELLEELDQDWNNPDCLITGLIGFGGEGKTSLTRQWVEKLRQGDSTPKGVFWWGFYEKSSANQFFEGLLKFLLPEIDPEQLPTGADKAQVIRAMLSKQRYLFILDGLEVLQHPEGDDYGLLTSIELREFLRNFAAGGHESFCLISSRAPLLDLIDFTTYTHRDVRHLSPQEGRNLLRNLGVKGSDAALNQVVADWEGYALVLSLLGAYLVDRYGGDVKYIRDIPPPTANETRYDRVHRVLRRYDEHLKAAEREFLMVLSVFRLPILEQAFKPVFQDKPGVPAIPTPPPAPSFLERVIRKFWRLIERLFPSQRRTSVSLRRKLDVPAADLDKITFNAMVRQLVNYRILRHNPQENYYTTHPLIRVHYSTQFKRNSVQFQAVHRRIAEYYIKLAGPILEYPTLKDLTPLIEAVHHFCQAGDYDQAYHVYWEQISQRTRLVLFYQLAAHDIELALMREFFPKGDFSQEPQVSNPSNKAFILNQIGLCLSSLGSKGEALTFLERSNEIRLSQKDWYNASITYHNRACMCADIGKLNDSKAAADKALIFARRQEGKTPEYNSLTDLGWVAHLQGDLEAAGAAFQQTEALHRKNNPTVRYLCQIHGIYHADYLRRVGDAEYARQVTEANLVINERNHWLNNISRCHRILGNLDTDAGNHDSARQHYNQALKIAQSISSQDVLIETLLARGSWAARRGEVDAAQSDLDEALNYAVTDGYRIYEADIRVGLAWMYLAAGNPAKAQSEAERAQRMSVEMGYHWGQVDAAEVLAALG